MDYLSLPIIEIHKALLDGTITPLELTMEALKRAKEDKNNAFEYVCDREALEQVKKLDNLDKTSLLWGIPYALKDNFSTKDIPTTASSNILNGYIPIFSSEVFLRLQNAGAILIGKTTLDELAMGGTGTSGHLGITFNPLDKEHKYLMGGSSCGSAAAMCAHIVPFAIGSDTGDSVRKPASNGNLVGLKPTWGRISRFGLFPFAPSLDHVAYFTNYVADAAIILEVLAGRDDKDSTSSNKKVDVYTDFNEDLQGKRFAIIKQIYETIPNKYVLDAFENLVTGLKNKGALVDFVDMSLDLCKAIYPTYMVISCAEATSNNANLDGIKFGKRFNGDDYEQIMTLSRTKGFSELIKRRFVIGSYVLSKENQEDTFLRAQRTRRLIVDACNKILSNYDSIILPASPSIAPLIDKNSSDKVQDDYFVADNYMAIANFGGYPSITVPLGHHDGMPFGVNLTAKPFDETNLFGLANGVFNLTKGGK